jgi:Zn-dependent peptidase ImmA (M78 family)
MHEIGHIYMKHLIDFDQTLLRRSTLNHKEYNILEEEANVFARNALAPAIVVKNLEYNDIVDVKEVFNLSNKAADVIFLRVSVRVKLQHYNGLILI